MSGRNEQDVEDVVNARAIREISEHGRTDSPHAEGKAEEEPGNHSHPARNEFLRIDENRGEGGSQNEPDDHGENHGASG